MAIIFTDPEIKELITEPKQIECSARTLWQSMKPKKRKQATYLQASHEFLHANGEDKWLIYLRINEKNLLDFSCGINFISKGSGKPFTLRRYNGKSHQHTNSLEREPFFYDFHIHEATERYQDSGYHEEHYATQTDRYADLRQALACLWSDFQITSTAPDDAQAELFIQ